MITTILQDILELTDFDILQEMGIPDDPDSLTDTLEELENLKTSATILLENITENKEVGDTYSDDLI
jgi:hypothetical protein